VYDIGLTLLDIDIISISITGALDLLMAILLFDADFIPPKVAVVVAVCAYANAELFILKFASMAPNENELLGIAMAIMGGAYMPGGGGGGGIIEPQGSNGFGEGTGLI